MKKLLLSLTIVLMLLALISCELFLEKPPKPTIHALFISLDYHDDDPDFTKFQSNRLVGTIRDVKEVEAAMTQLGDRFDITINIDRMLQEGRNPDVSDPDYPTVENILNRITDKVSTLTEEDILFIYYTGHGYETPSYLGALAVADPDDSTEIDILPSSDIMSILNAVEKGHIFFILDSCHSGVYVSDYPRTKQEREVSTEYNPRVFAMSASKPSQSSYELAIFRSPFDISSYDKTYDFNHPRNHFHGSFTNLFLEAIVWNHGTGENEELDSEGKTIITQVDGWVVDNSQIPVLKNGTISASDIYMYINSRIDNQRPLFIRGPKDLVLFSDRW